MKWTRPAMTSLSDSGAPLYGTWVASMPAASLNISPLIWVPLPMPAELKLIWPGRALA